MLSPMGLLKPFGASRCGFLPIIGVVRYCAGEGKVVIDWGPGAKSWVQWATLEKDKKIIQMPLSPVHSDN